MTEVLASEGATLADVVKTTLYLIDMGEFAAVNEVWVETFTENRPTRSAVAVAALAGRGPDRGRSLGLHAARLSARPRGGRRLALGTPARAVALGRHAGVPRHLPEAVTDRAHGLDQVGVLLAELGPQAADVDIDRARPAVVLVAPDPAQQASRG